MTSPVKKIVLFSAFLFIALSVMESYVRSLLKRCPQGNIAKVNAVMLHKLDAEVTVWGASTARVHFDTPLMEEKLGMSCFNVGLDGTPFQQYAGLLKEYIDYSTKGKMVVIAIDINGFGRRETLYQGYAWLHYIQNENVYDAIKSIDDELAQKSRFIPLYYLTTYDRRFLGRCLKWVYVSTDGQPEMEKSGFHPNDVPWQGKQHRSYDKPFNVAIDQEIVNNIRQIIDEAVEKNIKVAVVAPPCYGEVKNLILNLNSFEQVLNSFEAKNVKVFNFLGSPIAEEKVYFSNYTHLNAEGASKFTEIFVKDIQNWISTNYAVR